MYLPQDAVEPLFFQHIVIRSDTTLRLIAHTLRGCDIIYKPIATQIRSIEFRGMKIATSHQQPFSGYGNPILKCDTPSLTIDLMTILMGLSNLCSLTADGYNASAALAITNRLSGSTVRYLAIDMDQPELDALSALGYITYLSSLRELCLHLDISLESSECFTRLVPWNLIQLKKLTISWSGHDEHFNMSPFLGLCCFPALVALSLSGSLSPRTTWLNFLAHSSASKKRLSNSLG
jgi:hypothetical protein